MTPETLLKKRKALGLSQRALASAIGCDRGTITSYELGRYPIPLYIDLAIECLERRKKENQ